MKTLNEQVREIIENRDSKLKKSMSLIKLGLAPHEVSLLLGGLKVNKNSKFNANALTFGIEIECYNVRRDELIAQVAQRNVSIQSQGYNHTDSKDFYKIVSDGSIRGENGNEVVSPILKGKKGLDSLKNVCDSLNAVGAKVNKSTGLHVHFGAETISDAHFINIIKNYQKLERAIDSFLPLSRRADNNEYCMTLANYNLSYCNTKQDVVNLFRTRYTKVNAEAYLRHHTIEFRQHSGTTEYIKITKWIEFLRALIVYSFDQEIESCDSIEQIPFLSAAQKRYFIERRVQLA